MDVEGVGMGGWRVAWGGGGMGPTLIRVPFPCLRLHPGNCQLLPVDRNYKG